MAFLALACTCVSGCCPPQTCLPPAPYGAGMQLATGHAASATSAPRAGSQLCSALKRVLAEINIDLDSSVPLVMATWAIRIERGASRRPLLGEEVAGHLWSLAERQPPEILADHSHLVQDRCDEALTFIMRSIWSWTGVTLSQLYCFQS